MNAPIDWTDLYGSAYRSFFDDHSVKIDVRLTLACDHNRYNRQHQNSWPIDRASIARKVR
jgi:hypothetical protein